MTGRTSRVLTVAQELAEVSRLMDNDDVTAALSRFVARVVSTVPGCAEAAVTVRTAAGADKAAATGERRPGDAVESLGPIAEVLEHREPRRVDDTTTDRRWPQFSARLACQGYRSCLVLPVPNRRSSSSAALTLYSCTPNQFNDTVHDIGLLLTLHAGVVFDNAELFHDSRRLVEQLTAALETRQVIGQAQGLLMRHFGCDSERSFELLTGASQNTNTKLRDVASALVSAHDQDDFGNALVEFGLDACSEVESAPR
ncbi:GAF and ANTAR domain-containing protein [Lentzea sp. NPDC004789]